jgi:two-component system NarL family sensor kinase
MDSPGEVSFGALLLGSIGFMLLAACALVVFFNAYRQRGLAQQLERQASEAAHQQQLLVASIEAQEGERERIGQDLHDGIGSLLTTAKLLAGRLGSIPATEDPAELHTLLYNLMSAGVQDVRGLAHSLYPAVLARYGLAEALQHLVVVSNQAGPLPIGLVVAYPRPLPLAQELALYRICQELIHNALKHATGATRLTVQLSQQGAQLTLAVEDDGCGLPVAVPGLPLGAASGAGLRSVELRVQLLRARWRRESAPGQGTRMVIELDAPVAPSP